MAERAKIDTAFRRWLLKGEREARSRFGQSGSQAQLDKAELYRALRDEHDYRARHPA